MNNIENFKDIADEIMKDINVSQELIQRTLTRCKKKSRLHYNRFLILAACFVLIIAIAGVMKSLSSYNDEGRGPQINPLVGSGEGIQALLGESGSDTTEVPGNIKEWRIETLDEAKSCFDDSLLVPSYVPEDYKLKEIYASGYRQGKASKIILVYSAGDKEFTIIEEKDYIRDEFTGFERVDIDGVTGYLNSSSIGNEENQAGFDTELHWFIDSIHCSVMGFINKDEAIRIAASMK